MRIIYIPMALMLIFLKSWFFYVIVTEIPEVCLLEQTVIYKTQQTMDPQLF